MSLSTPTRGSWNLAGGTLQDGVVNETGGASLGVSSAAGTFSGGILANKTINGDLNLTLQANGYFYVLGTLTLNGTLMVGNASGTTFRDGLFWHRNAENKRKRNRRGKRHARRQRDRGVRGHAGETEAPDQQHGGPRRQHRTRWQSSFQAGLPNGADVYAVGGQFIIAPP